MICPKCQSPNTYIEDGMIACRMCSNRSLPPGIEPYKKRQQWKEEDKEMAIRACRNCGRVKKVIGDDLCGGCYFAVKGYDKGTSEYNQRLAAAKAKFTDPNYKCFPRGIRGKSGKTKKPVRSMAVRAHSDNIAEGAVIDQLTEQRDQYLAKAKKLDQAIELLS